MHLKSLCPSKLCNMSNFVMTVEEIAGGFVMGSLPPRLRQSVLLERLYNPELDQRIRELESALGGLSGAGEPEIDSQRIWSRIESALAKELEIFADKGVESFQDGAWQRHGDGIEVKQLWSDQAVLIRCAPGGFEAEHQQASDQDEHIIVIAGDLSLGGRSFATGDYICIPAGSLHQQMNSNGGCILFTEYKNVSNV